MYIFNISATDGSKAWLEEHKIDLCALSSALSLLVTEIHPTVKVIPKNITLRVVPNSDASHYAFKTNKISLCDEPYDRKYDSLAKKQKDIFDHFLHEFRHWMQSQFYNIGVREISYDDDDVINNTNNYYRNKLEIDARQFVRAYLTKFTKYYKTFVKIGQRSS